MPAGDEDRAEPVEACDILILSGRAQCHGSVTPPSPVMLVLVFRKLASAPMLPLAMNARVFV